MRRVPGARAGAAARSPCRAPLRWGRARLIPWLLPTAQPPLRDRLPSASPVSSRMGPVPSQRALALGSVLHGLGCATRGKAVSSCPSRGLGIASHAAAGGAFRPALSATPGPASLAASAASSRVCSFSACSRSQLRGLELPPVPRSPTCQPGPRDPGRTLQTWGLFGGGWARAAGSQA